MRTMLLALLLLTATAPAVAQTRVDTDRLHGTWRLAFALDPGAQESALGRIASKALAGVLDEVEIRFAFHDDARLRIMVDAFGEKDEDWGEWHLTDDGGLVLGENDHFDAEDTVWYFDGDRLVAYESGSDGSAGEVKGMSLERLDR